jgi:hypothetical protein
MSHLSTIIYRVKRCIEQLGPQAVKEPLFEQAVINLMEYLEAWTDAEPEEREEAMTLYDEWRPKLYGRGMPSHRQRLREADVIRANIIRARRGQLRRALADADAPPHIIEDIIARLLTMR